MTSWHRTEAENYNFRLEEQKTNRARVSQPFEKKQREKNGGDIRAREYGLGRKRAKASESKSEVIKIVVTAMDSVSKNSTEVEDELVYLKAKVKYLKNKNARLKKELEDAKKNESESQGEKKKTEGTTPAPTSNRNYSLYGDSSAENFGKMFVVKGNICGEAC